jgi:hypothetical protein
MQSRAEPAHDPLVQEQAVLRDTSCTNDGWNACDSNKRGQKCFNQGGWGEYVHDPSNQQSDVSIDTMSKERSRLDSYDRAKSDVVVTKENWSQTTLRQKHRSEHCIMDWESFTRYCSLDDPSFTFLIDR